MIIPKQNLKSLGKQTKKDVTWLRNSFCKEHLAPGTSETYTDNKPLHKNQSDT